MFRFNSSRFDSAVRTVVREDGDELSPLGTSVRASWMQHRSRRAAATPKEWIRFVNCEGSVMEEPVMSRLTRLPAIPFGWYYVALRSVANRRMVTSRAELVTALNVLQMALREGGARLHAGYITEREAHLALQAGERPVSAVIGRFQHEYARRFNLIHREHGSLFRLHHRLLLFQHRRWLVPLVRFIHGIPRLEAPAAAPGDLWWSSDSVFRGGAKLGWVTTNVLLRMLGHGDYDRRAQEYAYRELFDRAPDANHTRSIMQGSAEDPRLLGDAQFMAEVWRLAGRRSPSRVRRSHIPQGDIPDTVRQVMERFTALCAERVLTCQAANWKQVVTYEDLRSRSRRRPLPMLRALCVICLVEHDIATPAQAARFFGCGPRSVSARRRRFYALLFRELFRAAPDILFSPGRVANGRTGRPGSPARKKLATMAG